MSDGEFAWLNRGCGVFINTHTWDGFNRETERHENWHPTQKPVAVMEWIIGRAIGDSDALILDPYAGCCPTAIACIRTDRRCICIEKERKYWEIGVARCQREYARTALFDQAEALA
jgi:DNA modification methylase